MGAELEDPGELVVTPKRQTQRCLKKKNHDTGPTSIIPTMQLRKIKAE